MKIPIATIANILEKREYTQLAQLLRLCRYELKSLNVYGSRCRSDLTEVEVFASGKIYEQLVTLQWEDQNYILEAFQLCYPVRAGEIEINEIHYYPIEALVDQGSHTLSHEYLQAPELKSIQEQIRKAEERVQSGDYEGAITNASTLVETVCKQILHQQGKLSKQTGLKKLYDATAKALNMSAAGHQEDAFKRTLGGITTAIYGLSEIRNSYSDAHGTAPTRGYRLSKRHATLCIGLAQTTSEYLLAAYEERSNPQTK